MKIGEQRDVLFSWQPPFTNVEIALVTQYPPNRRWLISICTLFDCFWFQVYYIPFNLLILLTISHCFNYLPRPYPLSICRNSNIFWFFILSYLWCATKYKTNMPLISTVLIAPSNSTTFARISYQFNVYARYEIKMLAIWCYTVLHAILYLWEILLWCRYIFTTFLQDDVIMTSYDIIMTSYDVIT